MEVAELVKKIEVVLAEHVSQTFDQLKGQVQNSDGAIGVGLGFLIGKHRVFLTTDFKYTLQRTKKLPKKPELDKKVLDAMKVGEMMTYQEVVDAAGVEPTSEVGFALGYLLAQGKIEMVEPEAKWRRV